MTTLNPAAGRLRATGLALALALLPWRPIAAASLTPELTPAPRSSRFT
jgi:hypothetical protein